MPATMVGIRIDLLQPIIPVNKYSVGRRRQIFGSLCHLEEERLKDV
jgi:hypothetical protein